VLVNPRSGPGWSFDRLQRVFARHWDRAGMELTYQFTQSAADGVAKARRAAEQGVEALIVVGGDGTVSTVGAALLGTATALGVVPVGSGNGFARHFEIPLTPARAVAALAQAEPALIDVGVVNERPFLVTCSMAWDAAIVRSFERSPLRGIIPYVFAGAYELLGYVPQPIAAELDSGETLRFDDALIFTIANLTQYGGGAVIAPQARPDDGQLELVVARRQDVPQLVANVARLFNGTIERVPGLVFRRFRSLRVQRAQAAAIQVDGELATAPAEVTVRVLPRALRGLVPAGATAAAG